jgi:hypothetical protein
MADYSFTPSERQLLTSEGVVEGLKKLVAQNFSQTIASGYLSGWLGNWMLEPLTEASKEIKHLQGSVSRLENLSRIINRKLDIKFNDPLIAQFMNELKTFDGWTISLLETDLTIISFLDAKKGRNKLSELNSAMTALMNKRQTDQSPLEKGSDLFKKYVG